jgi:type IV secretory pathway component VirB8
MNAPFRLRPAGWTAATMSDAEAKAHVAEAPNRAEEVVRLARSFRKLGLILGGSLMVAGTAMFVSGAVMMARAPQARMQYGMIDSLNGTVIATVPAEDAPRYFSDDTAKQYLRLFVENCDGYIRDNIRNMVAQCTVLMDETMQARFREYFRSSNPESPQNRYNMAGAKAAPEGFRYAKAPSNGRVQAWNVYYTRVVSASGQVVAREPMALTIFFEWRPTMQMTDDARSRNAAGFQAVSFTFDKDPRR